MTPERQRIEEDLRGLVAGEVRCDPLFLQQYATDASLYEIVPTAVVRPRHTADVAATLKYASQQSLPVHARGAGSGLAGGAVGSGIVVDFSRYMRRIITQSATDVTLEPGVVHADLNEHLAQAGRCFGPDPAMSEVTTLGGVVSVDGAGSHRPVYGSPRDHVLGMTVVLSDGEVLQLSGDDESGEALSRERRAAIETELAALAAEKREIIERHTPQCPANSSGYALQAATKNSVDLRRLMVGSEGTLGLITELRLATQPLPAAKGSALLFFDSLDKAARAAQELAPLGPAACDLMDRRHLSLARENDSRYELLVPGAAEAVLLVEFFGDTPRAVRDSLQKTIDLVQYEEALAAGSLRAEDAADEQLYWRLAQRFVPTLHRLRGNRRALPGVEDVALPPTALPLFLRHMQDVLKQQDVTAAVFGHAVQGQLHIRPILDLTNRDDVRRLELLALELYEKVWLLGGSVSGEHGDGLSRTPFTSRQHGPLVNVFRDVKRIFDPAGILNPGKIVPAPGARMSHNVRPQFALDVEPAPAEPPRTYELQLAWTAEEALAAARECNGCGACRTDSAETRMCPINRFSPREEASPRAKANLMRSVLNGQLPPDIVRQDSFKRIADLCVGCHLCRLECPAAVDIPKLMLEAKAEYVKTNGLRIADWLSARIDTLSRIANKLPLTTNLLMRTPSVRWFLERTVGLAQGRKLPRINRRTYLGQAISRKLNKRQDDEREKVLYFVDTYANYYDSELARSFERILKRHDVALYVPDNQLHSAMTMISQGALDPARRIAERNVQLLAEAVRQGYTIVATEPSAALALRREYPLLLADDEDAQLVAESVTDAGHYLWRLHQRGGLKLDFAPLPLRIAYHVPCHLRALEIGATTENLLRLIPELRLERVEKGCSGMAGTFGMKQQNYRSSLRAGLPLLSHIRRGQYDFATTECCTCKMQIDQGARITTLHPLKILALSYGLLPDLATRLKLPGLTRQPASGRERK